MNLLDPQSSQLALPAPAWHTADTDSAQGREEFIQWLHGQSPDELFRLLDKQQTFTSFFFGYAEANCKMVAGKLVATIVKPTPCGEFTRNLSHEAWMATLERVKAVRYLIECALLSRYRDELQRRAEGREKAKWSRKANARRAA